MRRCITYRINQVSPIKLDYINLDVKQRILNAIPGNNSEPYPSYNKVKSAEKLSAKLVEKLFDDSNHSIKLQEKSNNSNNSNNFRNFRLSRDNLKQIAFVISTTMYFTHILLRHFNQR